MALILGFPTLIYPFGTDQGEYAWIATSTLNGSLCYSDIFNVKPPLTHVVHQAALLLFGHHMASIRILDLLWQGITAVLIFMIAKQIGHSSIAGVMAPVLYLFSYYAMGFWMTAQTDGFLTLPIAVAILLFLHTQQKRNPWLYVASGVAIGLGALFKYPIGMLGILLAILVIIRMKKSGFLPALLMGFGSLLPLVITVLIMFKRGNLADFLWIQSIYIPKYAAISNENINILHKSFLMAFVPSIIGWYGFFIGPSRKRSAAMAVIAIWWISAVFHLVIQNKFYDYHALPLFAPLALMVSNLFVDMLKTRNQLRFSLGALGASLLVLPFFMFNSLQEYTHLWEAATGHVSLQTIYSGKEFNGDGPSVREEMEVAEYLNSHTGKEEQIFIWGFEPTIYFLSQRANATRFAYNFLLYGPNAQPAFKEEFMDEIEIQKPSYVVIVSNDNMFHVTGTEDDSWAAYHSFEPFHNFVIQNYYLETTIGNFAIYRLDPSIWNSPIED